MEERVAHRAEADPGEAGRVAGAAERAFLAAFLEDLEGNRLRLPSLPEVALRVRRLAADPAVTARRIAQALRGRRPIEDPQQAVARLGVERLRQMVAALAVHQLLHGRRARRTRDRLAALWRHSTRVGALSHVLAHRVGGVEPELALLAGLVHDIGALVVLERLEDCPDLAGDPEAVGRLVRRLHTVVGPLVLEAWAFPQPVVEAAARHERLWEGPEAGEARTDRVVDVVTVANLHAHLGSPHPLGAVPWDRVPAFARLGLAPEDSVAAVREARQELLELERALAAG